jgi:hypothetical protein
VHFTREKAGKMLIFGGGSKKGQKWPKSGVRGSKIGVLGVKMAKIRGPDAKKGQNRWTFDWPFFGRVKILLFGENGKIDGISLGLFLGFWGSKMVKFWSKTKKCGKK